MNVKNCIRCGQWFAPNDPNQCICVNCANQMESKSVIWWFAALAGTVIAILAWHYFIKQL